MSSDNTHPNIRFKIIVDLPNRLPQNLYYKVKDSDKIETIEDLKRLLKAILSLNNDYGIDLFIDKFLLTDGSDLSIIRDEETIVVRSQTDWEDSRSDDSVAIIPVNIKSEPIEVVLIDDNSSIDTNNDSPPPLSQIREQISPLIGLPSYPRNNQRLNSTESSINSSTQTSDDNISSRLTRSKSNQRKREQKPKPKKKSNKKTNPRFETNTNDLVFEKRLKKPKIYKDFYCFY